MYFMYKNPKKKFTLKFRGFTSRKFPKEKEMRQSIYPWMFNTTIFTVAKKWEFG